MCEDKPEQCDKVMVYADDCTECKRERGPPRPKDPALRNLQRKPSTLFLSLPPLENGTEVRISQLHLPTPYRRRRRPLRPPLLLSRFRRERGEHARRLRPWIFGEVLMLQHLLRRRSMCGVEGEEGGEEIGACIREGGKARANEGFIVTGGA